MRKIFASTIIVILTGIVILFLSLKKPNIPQNNPVFDHKNTTYEIEGQKITLVNGRIETEVAPGSASKLITQYFGGDVSGDLNNDGATDIAFILTQSGGGSGAFYYVVAALKNNKGYQGTNAILLGDRIAPQTSEIKNDTLIINYADRQPGEPMTTQPSVNKSKYIVIEDTKLVETPIFVESPQRNSYISSPLTIAGVARGPWFFEATFPVVLTDWDGKIIAQHYAQAKSEWMTTDFVPFEAVLEFEKPIYGERGFLILKKDNPSGLPEYDDSREIPIFFK